MKIAKIMNKCNFIFVSLFFFQLFAKLTSNVQAFCSLSGAVQSRSSSLSSLPMALNANSNELTFDETTPTTGRRKPRLIGKIRSAARNAKRTFQSFRQLEASGKSSKQMNDISYIKQQLTDEASRLEKICAIAAAKVGRGVGKVFGGAGPEFWRD